jgi:hypothetical protein
VGSAFRARYSAVRAGRSISAIGASPRDARHASIASTFRPRSSIALLKAASCPSLLSALCAPFGGAAPAIRASISSKRIAFAKDPHDRSSSSGNEYRFLAS